MVADYSFFMWLILQKKVWVSMLTYCLVFEQNKVEM